MRNPAYAAFCALDPFFDIVRRGLADLVDGDHYFDTIAPDAVFEFRYRFPGYPTKIVGREALMSATPTGRRSPTCISRMSRAGNPHPSCSPATRCGGLQ